MCKAGNTISIIKLLFNSFITKQKNRVEKWFKLYTVDILKISTLKHICGIIYIFLKHMLDKALIFKQQEGLTVLYNL